MPEVAREQTSASLEQLRAELELAAPELSANQRAMLLAQIALENDRGRAIYNQNVGNLTVSKAQESAKDFYRPFWYVVDEQSADRLKRLHELMLEGKAPSAFAAFPSLAEGMRVYTSWIRSKFPSLLSATTPEQFVSAWRSSGYTPDLNVTATLPNFTKFFVELGGSLTPERARSGVGSLLLIGGAAAALLLLGRKR